MNNARIAKEILAAARELISAKKGKYTDADVKKAIKGLKEYIKRGGREYGDYQFNIKLGYVDTPDSVTEEHGENLVGDFAMEEASQRVKVLADQVKQRFGWVGDAGAAGRSGGWFTVEDNDYTMDSLERAEGSVEARDELDDTDNYFEEDWKELEEEVSGAVNEGRQKARDLGEIEKMVKAGVADYVKDMKSERWWNNVLG